MKISPDLQKIEQAMSPEQREGLQKVSKQFESLFMNQMLRAMRKTVPDNGFMPKSHAQNVYESMMDSEHAAQMSETEQLGLSTLIYEHLLQASSLR